MPQRAVPQMIIPSAASTAAFVAILIALCVAFVAAVARAGRERGEPHARTRAVTWRAALGLAAWVALMSAVSMSSLLERQVTPPPLMAFLFVSQLVAAIAAFSPLGTRLLALPLAYLVGFQLFRLPLEFVLHDWVAQGTLPRQMTFDGGDNYDIVSGALALPAALCAWKWPERRAPIWLFNIIGFALLLNVGRVAATSSPVPFRTYLDDPPVLLAFHFPYGLIVPLCVGGALFGHLLVFRALFSAARPTSS
jgi:hypothetical protein